MNKSIRNPAENFRRPTQVLFLSQAFPGLLSLAAMFAAQLPTSAQFSEAWIHRDTSVSSNAYDRAVQVVMDATGDVVVTGVTGGGISGTDMVTIKYSGATGTMLWRQHYNTPAGFDDEPAALAVDAHGDIVMSGPSSGSASYGDLDFYTAKYSGKDGLLLWEQRYGIYGKGEYPKAIAVDSAGDVVVTGNEGGTYTAKYAGSTGALLWSTHSNGTFYSADAGGAVTVDSEGNVLLTAAGVDGKLQVVTKLAASSGAILWTRPTPHGGRSIVVDPSGDVVAGGRSGTVKYRSDGTLLWTQDLSVTALVVDESGDVIITGEQGSAKYATADGALLWERRVTLGDYRDYFRSLVINADGDVVLTGSFGHVRGEMATPSHVTAKLASQTGDLLWERRQEGFGEDVAIAPDGDIVVTGSSNSDILTVKLAAEDGTSRWEVRQDGLVNRFDTAQAVAFDGAGDVIVAGSAGTESGSDYLIAKHSAADGAVIWKQRTPGDPAFWYGQKQFNVLAVDGEGNVIAAGASHNFDGPYISYIAKYSGESGALLWDQYYAGQNGNWAFSGALALAVDDQNGVVVTGSTGTVMYRADGALVWSSPDPGTALVVDDDHVYVIGHSLNPELSDSPYTAKRSVRDGRLIWAARFGSRFGNEDDQIRGIVVDQHGDVVVAGQSSNSPNLDSYTAKYAAADGTLLWERRYKGNSGGRDAALAVGLDAEGNVVITGYADGSETDYEDGDRSTAKYAAADGSLLWERRDRGVAAGRALVVNARGDVVVSGAAIGSDRDGYQTTIYSGSNGTLLGESWLDYRPQGAGIYLTMLSRRSLALRHDGALALTGSFDGDVVTVLYREKVPDLSVSRSRQGTHLRFTGYPGNVYRLERGTALGGPWTVITQLGAPADGVVHYVDQSAPDDLAFYRILRP